MRVLAIVPGTPEKTSKAAMLASLWIIFCIGFSAFEIFAYGTPYFPEALRSLLAANYLE